MQVGEAIDLDFVDEFERLAGRERRGQRGVVGDAAMHRLTTDGIGLANGLLAFGGVHDEIDLIVNTTEGKQAIRESNSIRREAVHRRVTYYTTLAAALATCEALEHIDEVEVNRLADLHQETLGA